MEILCAVKKVQGKLIHNSEEVQWMPAAGGNSQAIKLSEIQGMQATPPTASKLRIKLTTKDGSALMLEFSGATDLEKARNELQLAIKSYRDQSEQSAKSSKTPSQTSTPTGSTPQQLPSAKPTSSSVKKSSKKLSLEPAKLLQNIELQKSLLRQDPELMRAFQQVVIASGALTNEQFWSLRMQLLITAAQQQMQTRGSYNVLSTIKPTTGSDNKININLTREKIADVFDQYPLVRKAYNENVPKLSEGEFWQRFFMSKLFLVLRGEKVASNHTPDAVFDPYIDILYELQEKQRVRRAAEDTEHQAPLFINVEANAENNPETYGNNLETNFGKGTRGLIRSMNGLSHRLLLGKRRQKDDSTTPPSDGTNDMESELILNDLAEAPSRTHEVDLKLRLTQGEQPKVSNEAIVGLLVQLQEQAPDHVSLDATLDSILDGSSRSEQIITSLTPANTDSEDQNAAVSSEVLLTHTTSLEFLKHFWNAYSRSPTEAVSLREYIVKSKERVQALPLESRGLLQSVVKSLDRALELTL